MKQFLVIVVALLGTMSTVWAQNTGVISGTVIDKNNQTPIPGVSVTVSGTGKGQVTDSLGKFRITGIPTKTYSIEFSKIGYKTFTLYNVVLTSGNEALYNIELEPEIKQVSEVVVTGRKTVKAATLETPLSTQRLTSEEIKTNPGGNFDISRVVNTLPGVGGTSGSVGGYRNDIIIRGGAPNENVYYLDGIEVPVINHFATQGSAGGPAGILNVSFIEDVRLSSSAFDARYDNALSSVLQFKQRNGNPNRFQGNFRLSGTEIAGTMEGPISKNTTFLASVRRSYLQLLFQALDLPIRPNYWDFQYKIVHKVDSKTTLTFLGVGAIDEFSFAAPKEASPEKLYIINSNGINQQWNYTIGLSLKRNINNGYWNLAISRNKLNNEIEKYEDNQDPKASEIVFDLNSQEIENKLRFDVNKTYNGWKVSYGAMLQLVDYNTRSFTVFSRPVTDNIGTIIQPGETSVFTSPLNNFWKMGAFVQAGKRFANNRLGISAGVRTDMNTFTTNGMNGARTLSPRVALSYVLTDKITLNASVGRYYKIQPYTILGFADNSNTLVNKNTDYTRSDHFVAGAEFLPNSFLRFTVEGFYKRYNHVPVSVRDGISLANMGGGFGVFGNEKVNTNGTGDTYGFELFAQQKLTKRFFGIFSYTFFYSKFAGADGKRIASAWDNRHLLSITWGYKFPKNWELGLKFRFQGGAPYTPFDTTLSKQRFQYIGSGVLDYSRLNSNKLAAFHASDVRIDKKWNFKHLTLDLYLDVTNWYGAGNPAYPQFTYRRNADNTAFVTTDGQPVKSDGSNVLWTILSNNDGTVVPTIGFIIEF